MSKPSILDELEADGEATVAAIREHTLKLTKRVFRRGQRRARQAAKITALGNMVFQEVVDEIKKRTPLA